MSKQWIWITEAYQYILSYSQDVDVFSFGLLKAKKEFLTVKISVANLTEGCKFNVGQYLLHHFSHVREGSNTTTDTIQETPKGHLCFAKLERNKFEDFISDISGVKIGFPVWCYTENNESVFIGKSYVIYIVICIILCMYSFYPIFMEMAFYVEDRKADDGKYYMSDSPYSPSIICKRLIFLENNKYLATLRILVIAILLTSLVYYLKSEIYYSCNCSLKLPNDDNSSLDVENFYKIFSSEFALGVIHFIIVNMCVLLNSNGDFDDFILLDITNILNKYFFFRTVPVSKFLLRDCSKEKKVMSFKIKKLSLLFSYKFWTQILFINSRRSLVKHGCVLLHILCPIQIILNFFLVLCSILCPVVFIVYVFFVKYSIALILCVINCCIKYIFREKCKLLHIEKQNGIRNIASHTLAIFYLYYVYTSSFNIFFNGMSYVIQFIIFTLLFAVPRFSIQTYIYVIFTTSLVFHIFRYIYQFTKLYKTLLETVLKLQEENSISIKHFDKIVSKHFPVSNEGFYLFLKIMLSSLFFVIIYDTMQKVGYIRFGAQPDLTTVITFFFFFGPPRLIEGLFMTDFTSRVYMKEEEIKKDIEELVKYDGFDSKLCLTKQPEYIILCKRCETDGTVCKIMRYICTYFFGCFQCRVDEEGFCECCDCLSLNSEQSTRTIIKIPTWCLYKRQDECETVILYLSDSHNPTSSESGHQNTNELRKFSSMRPHHDESDDLNINESNSPHRIGSNISNSISPSNGEPDSQSSRTSNRSNESRLNFSNLTEPDSTIQNGFEETDLCVPTIQTTNGSNSLIPSDSESLNTIVEGNYLQNNSVHDNKDVSSGLKCLETRQKKISDLMIADAITNL